MPDKSTEGDNKKTMALSAEVADNRILRDRIKSLEQSIRNYEKQAIEQKKTLQKEIAWHKETEAELQVSQRQLAQAMDLARIVYWELDPEKGEFIFNDAFYAFFGTTAEQEGGYKMSADRYAEKFVHPDDLQIFFNNRVKVAANPEREFSADIEHRIICADGEVRHIFARVKVFKDKDGHTTRIYGANQDITDRKQVENSLLQTVSLLSATLESTTDGILVVDRTGKIVNFNNKFLEMWRIPDDVITKKDDGLALDFVLNQLENPDDFISKVKALYNQPETESFDILNFKDGRIFERFSRPQYIGDEVVGKVWSFRDVTERKLAESALLESRQLLRTILDAVPSPIFYKDIHEVYQGCNTAFESFVGLTRQEIIGKTACDIAPQELADKYHEMDIALFRQGGTQVYESKVRRTDGTFHNVLFYKALYKNSKDAVAGLVGIILDITERKQAEEELRKSYAIISSVIESPKEVVIFALDRQYRYIAFNKNHQETMKRIWGMDIRLGVSMLEYISNPGDRMKAKANFDRALSGESFTVVEEYGDTAFDRRFYEDIYNPITDEKGDVIGLTLFLTDITERRRAEEQIRLSEAHFRALIENISDMISILNPNGTIRYISPSVTHSLGYTPAELIGKNTFEMIHPEDVTTVSDSFKKDVASPGAISRHEVRRRHKDGSWRILEVLRQNLMDNEAVKGILVTARDITERKQMEEALRSLNDELEAKVEKRTKQLIKAQDELIRKEKLAILGQLAGTVGHEIRNPLGVMNNAVYFLKSILPDAEDTVTEYLNIIQQEIDNSLQIITDLLDFSRTKPPKKIPVSIDAWVYQALDRCNIPENVLVKVSVPEGQPLVNIDLFQMIQVLQNLITNAVHAMEGGGRLEISAGLDQSREAQDSTSAEDVQKFFNICVRDTGTGISPENMEKLFQPLFTTKPKGIGLGLVVCKNLVEANGGEISIESRLKEGTTFTIKLPIFQE